MFEWWQRPKGFPESTFLDRYKKGAPEMPDVLTTRRPLRFCAFGLLVGFPASVADGFGVVSSSFSEVFHPGLVGRSCRTL